MLLPLSIAELKTLTRRRTRKAVRATLQSWGVCYREDLDGWPVVLRAHVEQILCGEAATRREGPRLAFLGTRNMRGNQEKPSPMAGAARVGTRGVE